MTRLCPGHNRLSCAECGVVPETREDMILRRANDLAAFAREHRLSRLVLEDGGPGAGFRVEFERHPSAFVPVVADAAPEVDADRCACGHSLSVEHSESGCFHGCAADKCNTTEVA